MIDENGNKVKLNECFVESALVVNSNDVKMYDLVCEHSAQHQMV